MYHSLKNLLSQYSMYTNNQVAELTSHIIKNKELAVAIIEDEPDDDGLDTVFSILSLVSLDDSPFGKQIKDYFLKKSQTHWK
jgi:hypothetical protein